MADAELKRLIWMLTAGYCAGVIVAFVMFTLDVISA